MRHASLRIAGLALWCAILAAPLFGHDGYSRERGKAAQKKLVELSETVVLFDDIWKDNPYQRWQPAAPLNEIDEITFAKMRADGVPINALSPDEMFIRRASLLLTGRLPEPADTRAFLADESPGKRAAYIDAVLASDAFDTHWSFWFQEYFQSNGQLLRAGLLYYNDYLSQAVADEKPLDVMARELLTTLGLSDQVGEANFYVRAINGARLRQDFWDNAAIQASAKFLGVPLECISCHDGAYHLENINLYLAEKKRADVWAMAAFFSGVDRRIGTRDGNLVLSVDIYARPTRGYNAQSETGDRPPRDGGLIAPKYLFTGEEPQSDQAFHTAFAEMVVRDRQFARNFANRLWGHLFGLAMVEPMDGFDLYRIDPERTLPEGWERQALDLNLLEHMTQKLIDLKFDLKSYLRYVMNSATFQMSAEFKPGGWKETYAPYYTRFLARRMNAEAVYDSVTAATGVQVPMVQGGRYGVLPPVSYAHQLEDNTQPRGQRQVSVFNFLEAFGRGNRYDTPRSNQGNIGQALELMNSPVIMARIASPDNRLNAYIAAAMPAEQIVEELFLDILCRKPTDGEAQTLLAELDNYPTLAEKVTTIQWLLLNRVEFAFIY